MCGAGTIPIERHDAMPGGLILAADKYELPLSQARANLAAFGAPGALMRSDAITMPLAAGCVDKIVSNLPWGRRIGSHKIDQWLYPRFLSEASRVLRPGGMMVLLTLERRLILGLLERRGEFELLSRLMVDVSGMHPSIYVLRRG